VTPAEPGRWATRGQPAALAAVAGMARGRPPHAVLLVGPPSVGKTTLAEDLAAAVLCRAADPGARPCRTCRSCRMIAGGNHPDLHRLGPEGAAGQVVIGDPGDPRAARGVRDLVRELAFLPVEGGVRVAIVAGASRMNEDAQNALLKTLEEPPPDVVLVLCADEEETLLPTVRSRCARVRLGRSGPREIEALLGELGLADAPTAARLARVADGRPGLAVAYARSPETLVVRDEIGRSLLDLLTARPARRLATAKDLLERAREVALALDGADRPEADGRPRRSSTPPEPADPGERADEAAPAGRGGPDGTRIPPAERRQAARELLAIWRDLTRDLAVVMAGGLGEVRDPAFIDELASAAADLPVGAAVAFLARLERAAELVAGNVGPELVVDVLLLTWPAVAEPAA
jgi:DNA polymerase III subunit delta'